MIIDIVSSSTKELEAILKECHWNLEMLGIFMKIMLVGAYFNPTHHSLNISFLFFQSTYDKAKGGPSMRPEWAGTPLEFYFVYFIG
ncbi:hypothetical protein HanIR_Chr05g0246381 [Helianthus annuus]|nr:hypothetical protein HanIR_Chr05g0246381 [Helianthus annuus]